MNNQVTLQQKTEYINDLSRRLETLAYSGAKSATGFTKHDGNRLDAEEVFATTRKMIGESTHSKTNKSIATGIEFNAQTGEVNVAYSFALPKHYKGQIKGMANNFKRKVTIANRLKMKSVKKGYTTDDGELAIAPLAMNISHRT